MPPVNGAPASGLASLERIDRETVSGRVYRDLRELLISGEISPGEKLALRSVAAALGTSLMPVRDAVARLAAEQAVEVMPNRTVRVPVMTRGRFEELRTIRLMLEGHCTEMAAAHATPQDLTRIRELHADFTAEHDMDDPDAGRLIRLNKEFHFAVYKASRMPVALQMIEGLWLQIGPVLNFDLRTKSERLSRRVAVGHHTELLAALERRDGPAARKALSDDIVSAGDFILGRNVLPVT
ncbi:MAG TPA: GntR family transcriptional regulator [Skermanella sp.]|jgi:DNA-binding GntR family transcriptional regulator|nr:GntR family transcriptional regulator [Skermanella sp.]